MSKMPKIIFEIDILLYHIYNKNVSAYIIRNGSPDDVKKGVEEIEKRKERET